jgi:hypothetical protein
MFPNATASRTKLERKKVLIAWLVDHSHLWLVRDLRDREIILNLIHHMKRAGIYSAKTHDLDIEPQVPALLAGALKALETKKRA